MNIKILCACETKFAFDVEPVNGRMPVRVNCPNCGADGTDAANAIIQEQLAASAIPEPTPAAPASRSAARVVVPPTDSKARIRIGGAAPAPEPVAAPHSPEGEAPADGSSPEAAPVTPCPKHPRQAAVNSCFVCGKPICLTCMEQFGYLCSVYCQSQASARGIQVPHFEGRKVAVRAKEWKKTKLMLAGVAGVIALMFAAYGWYVFSGSKPRTYYSLKFTKAERPVFSQLLSTDEMLVMRANKLERINVGNGKEVWSVTLPAPPPPPARPPAAAGRLSSLDEDDDEDFLPPAPKLQVTGDDVWVSVADRVVRYDLKTGKVKTEVPIKERVQEVQFTDGSILVTAENAARQKTLTHIPLATGAARTEVLAAPRVVPGRVLPGGARALGDDDDGGGGADTWVSSGGEDLLPAGENVVQFQSRLIEKRLVAVQAMKEAPKQSTLDSGRLSARDSMKAVGEMMNEMQRERTGGVSYENESRYQVTLRRLAPTGSPDWTGEVAGQPALFPQKTVDALIAGKTIQAFSKRNQKLWEGKLSYPLADRMLQGSFGDNPVSACLEEAGSLYVWDKGTLTAFDAKTGNVRWRVPSVGISNVVRDGSGMLYVSTTTASPDSIQFSQQIKLGEKDHPVIMKVDASSGKVHWKADQLGDRCYVSGKYIYVTESRVSGLDVIRSGGDDSEVPVHHRIYRLNPSNGSYIWQYYRPQAPQRITVQQNRLLLQYASEFRVLTFM